jgi:outer membrane protein
MALMRALLLGFALLPLPAFAQDLLQVFRDAKEHDAPYAAARNALQAGLEKLPQGRALLLPTLDLVSTSTGATNSSITVTPRNNAIPSSQRDVTAYSYQLRFTQPLYRPQNLLQYDQAEFQVKQAEAAFGQAAQDLIVRTAQAYFDVLTAQDSLTLLRAQKAATSEQLAQAKRNFEVGTATITDTHEAQARYDLIVAQEIVGENAVETQLRALQQITGKRYRPGSLKTIRLGVKHEPPRPASMQEWVDLAERQGFPVVQQEATTEIAGLEAKRTAAAQRPTLDLVGTYGTVQQTGSTIIIGSPAANITTGAVSLQFGMPLYAGGALSSREREAAALYEKSKQDLENIRRSQAFQARQNYLLVINGISVVNALEQAVISSQSALDSNKLGYEVGVRINIDVLNAQNQVFSAARDLATARYGTIMNHLKLKATAGSLRDEDLDVVNRALEQ